MNKNANEPRLLDHEADGIKELDNLLPRWWVWLFYLTTLFAILYMGYYHVFSHGRPAGRRVRQGMEDWRGAQEGLAGEIRGQPGCVDPLKGQSGAGAGRQIYVNLCKPCHRDDGGGLVGPNLCDDYWIHGSNYVDNVKTIINGVPAKGMITWRGLLKPNDIEAVASYIYTLRGTNPKNPKPPGKPAAAGGAEYL